MKLKDIPREDRPREKLLEKGVKSLTNAELLAILLNTGNKKENAVQLAQKVLSKYNVSEIATKHTKDLRSINGIGITKACKLIASAELATRIKYSAKKQKIKNKDDVLRILNQKMHGLRQEHFVMMHIDSRNNILNTETIFIGTANETTIHPRDIFQRAIQNNATAIIVAHNHPSGDATPSKHDIELTQMLKQSGELLAIPVIDHIIIGNNGHFSMKEQGLL